MNGHRYGLTGQHTGNPVGRKHRIAAGIVGNGEPVDARVLGECFAEVDEFVLFAGSRNAARADQFRAVHEPSAGNGGSKSLSITNWIHVDYLCFVDPPH